MELGPDEGKGVSGVWLMSIMYGGHEDYGVRMGGWMLKSPVERGGVNGKCDWCRGVVVDVGNMWG